MTALKPPDQPSTARVLVQTLSTSPDCATNNAQVKDLRHLWTEGLVGGDPRPVDDDWFASIGKRGMERLEEARGAPDAAERIPSAILLVKCRRNS